ncbi:lantibiotic dehydratase family protein [Cytobacillus sp. FSL R5-0377]|uniref:lantibiotic dehydratase family protein n=1 Tax=Cytobacillus sp. FSL R5-0377 TaxID=2954543 RepID=UPI0030F99D0A
MNKLNFSSSFSVGNFFMLRSPLFPLQSFIELNKKLNSLHDNELLFIDDLIIELKNNRIFMESILISSKNLYKALINFNSETNKKKKKQIFSSVIKYINRISTRSTPFGINAGFVMGEFSDSSSLNIGEIESHSTRIRPDMEWLLGVVKILDENILYLKNINVQTNNMIYKKYNKVHLPYVTSYGQKKEGKYSLEGNTISQNPLILFILEELKVRMSLETIAHKVRDEFEGAELENIYGLLVELIKAEYILTELRPQLTAAHPLDNLIKVLSGCNPPTSSVPGQIYKTLVDLELLMRKYDKLSIGQGIELLEEIEILMKSLLDHGNDYYQIDLRINEKAPMKLNEQLKEDILIAADILERLHTSNNSFSHLELYREEFIDLYGEKSEVPLLELLDEDIGLGAPLTYEYPVSKKRSRFPAANKNKVNPILIDLFNKAVFSNEFEINLTDKDIMKFNEDFQPKKPLSLELTFSIMANSESHVDSGDYKLIMFGGGHLGSNGAGNSIGRFYDMLPQKYKKDIKKLGQIVESRIDEKEVLISEIVYNPRKGKSTNLVITPNIHNYEISLGTIGSKESKNIPLDDILVGCTDEGFYLRSKKHNKRIKALKLNVLNPSFASHNIYRFLYEVGMENEIIERDINWGPYNYMLYTPRVTYKNIVILQAKWRINNAVLDLDNKNNNFKIWKTGFLKWKEKLSLPRFVYLAETDNRLLLDLEEDLSLLILHRRLRQITTDKLTLVEYGSEQLKSPISNKNSIFQGECDC